MIVSDSHKFIFFHVPKSAGTSIACKLAEYSNNRQLLFPYYELHIEDIIEEIVGEISDEHDVEVDQMIDTSDGKLLVDGGMSIRDLNRAYDWSLPDYEANTIAGLVIHEEQ